MNLLKKFAGFFAAVALLTSPVLISAECHHHEHRNITGDDVEGYYQTSGFSNSLDGIGSPTQPQSQATVGQARFFDDGTGVITFVDLVVIIGGDLVDIHQENLPFTYTLGPINGQGTVTIPNFPVPGLVPVFAISFKKHDGKVTGFSLLIIDNNVPTSRWTLIQGERFN